jgi:hypothetical protein
MSVEMEGPPTISSEADPALLPPQGMGALGQKLSRRSLVARATFFGTAMAAIGEIAKAQEGGSGSYSNAAIALPDDSVAANSREEQSRAVKIARAMRAGPPTITEHATIAEMDAQGRMTNVLRQGTNEWICMPGNENVVGDPPMCVDALGMQWFKDLHQGKPQPTNKAPGLCYMLCGATQHSNTNVHDRTSAAIPIGPHWMILWPFDASHCGLPTTVRDAGAWIMFAGTPYAYLHVCGTPWVGNEYRPGDEAIWTMRYKQRTAG